MSKKNKNLNKAELLARREHIRMLAHERLIELEEDDIDEEVDDLSEEDITNLADEQIIDLINDELTEKRPLDDVDDYEREHGQLIDEEDDAFEEDGY